MLLQNLIDFLYNIAIVVGAGFGFGFGFIMGIVLAIALTNAWGVSPS